MLTSHDKNIVKFAKITSHSAERGNGLLRLVGVRGFEPPTPASRKQCSTKLSYTPTRRVGFMLSSTLSTNGGRVYTKRANASILTRDNKFTNVQ